MTGRAFTYVDGRWFEGNPPLIGPMDHALWMASVVFDGARAFEGVTPDLDRHCARVVRSARAIGLQPMLSGGEIEDLVRDGLGRFPADAALYIRPMFYARDGFVIPEPASTRFLLTLMDLPMPSEAGFTAGLSTRRRPLPGTAPLDAKASCLYPNVSLVLAEARARGFDSAVVLDPDGHLAEFAIANLFLVRDGVVHTPVCNGTFLDGITRQRVIGLLRDAGVPVTEATLTLADLLAADEVFSTGNYGKVMPLTRFEDRVIAPGPVGALARRLYWAFAHG
jgi:branched-chain amino acid aminotransferase